jgi:hypothetical protein
MIILSTSPLQAKYADYDVEKPPVYGKGKYEIGVLGAYSWNTGDHSRLGVAAKGAGFVANLGYMFEPWLVFPEVVFATSFTSARTQEWELGGYEVPASYIGYTGYQVGVGARVRTGSTTSKLWPYLSGGVVYFFGSRDAMTPGDFVLDSFKSKGPGFYAGAGVDMYLIGEDWAAAVFDVRYMYSPQKWDERGGAPGLVRDFTLTEFRFNLGLRFFIL